MFGCPSNTSHSVCAAGRFIGTGIWNHNQNEQQSALQGWMLVDQLCKDKIYDSCLPVYTPGFGPL